MEPTSNVIKISDLRRIAWLKANGQILRWATYSENGLMTATFVRTARTDDLLAAWNDPDRQEMRAVLIKFAAVMHRGLTALDGPEGLAKARAMEQVLRAKHKRQHRANRRDRAAAAAKVSP